MPRNAVPQSRALVALLLAAVLGGACTGDPGDPADREEGGTTRGTSPGTVTEPPPPPRPPLPSVELGLRPGWGPDRAELDRAVRAVRRLPLPALAGQVIVASYRGTAAPVGLVDGQHLGGVISFSENVASPRQVQGVHARLRRAADRAWPLFLAVDQEGGLVQRVAAGTTRFPTFMTAGAADRPGLTQRAVGALGADLRRLGFTVDFAPVADVTSGVSDPTIGSRSPGSAPALVARHANAAAAGLLESGVVPVVKHFPGHGSVPADSHERLPVQRRSLARLRSTDLTPFREAVAAGVPAVMLAHLDVRAVDPGTPSSLSRPVVTGLLRRDLGFHGLVVTDALDMAAVTARYDSAASAVRALRAGADVVLMPPSPSAARRGIVRAVRSGALPRGRVEQAAARQVALLRHLAQERRRGRPRPVRSGAASEAWSRAAVTVVAGPCRGRLVRRGVSVGGDGEATAAFRAAARAAGLRTDGGTPVTLLGYGDPAVSRGVAVAVDAPYVLGASRAPVRIATYGATPGAMRALVDVLIGRRRGPGRLPVPVAGVPRQGC